MCPGQARVLGYFTSPGTNLDYPRLGGGHGRTHRPRAPRLLYDRDYEDSYNDQGSPLSRRMPNGTYLIANVTGSIPESGWKPAKVMAEGGQEWCHADGTGAITVENGHDSRTRGRRGE